MNKRRVISILVAATKEGKLFYLTGPYTREELAAARKTTQFFCPTCGSSVILKIGEVKTSHFAHKNLSHCDTYSESESPLHLLGKTQLYQFFSSKHLPVEIERYFPAIRQRADLFVGQNTAIEFQCSPIAASQVSARSHGYSQMNIAVIWIGALTKPLLEGIQRIKITEWKRAMLQHNQKNGSYMLLFSPEENRFYYISNLIYVSGSQWVGKVKALDVSKQQFPFAVPKTMTETEFRLMCSIFYQAREKFIASQYYAKNRVQNLYWRSCYELGLDVRNLPEAIGLPMKNAELFSCNAVLWQLLAVRGAEKGTSAASLVQSGQLPIHQGSAGQKAEALIESYLDLYNKFKKQSGGKVSSAPLLYDFYCKSL